MSKTQLRGINQIMKENRRETGQLPLPLKKHGEVNRYDIYPAFTLPEFLKSETEIDELTSPFK